MLKTNSVKCALVYTLYCNMHLLKVHGFCLNMVLLAGSLHAQNKWIVRKEKEGIKISTRQSDRSLFNDIKVEMDLPGSIYQLATILMDVDQYTQWSNSLKKSVLIKKEGANKLIYYSEINAPWPASNRDLYAVMDITTDSVSQSLKVISVGEKNYRPAIKNLVRIPYSKGVWEITTVNNKSIHLNYVLEVDPGGSVPAWIMNLFSTKAPMETFESLKDKMALLNPSNKYLVSKP
jgi:hypothetical protein